METSFFGNSEEKPTARQGFASINPLQSDPGPSWLDFTSILHVTYDASSLTVSVEFHRHSLSFPTPRLSAICNLSANLVARVQQHFCPLSFRSRSCPLPPSPALPGTNPNPRAKIVQSFPLLSLSCIADFNHVPCRSCSARGWRRRPESSQCHWFPHVRSREGPVAKK